MPSGMVLHPATFTLTSYQAEDLPRSKKLTMSANDTSIVMEPCAVSMCLLYLE